MASRRKTAETRIGDKRMRKKDGIRDRKICSKYKVKSNDRHSWATDGPKLLSLPASRHVEFEDNI